jgi:hypothetical protein
MLELPAIFLPSLSYVRVAAKHEQRRRMYPAYIYNVSQSLLRADLAAFFDGYGVTGDEIRCASAALSCQLLLSAASFWLTATGA